MQCEASSTSDLRTHRSAINVSALKSQTSFEFQSKQNVVDESGMLFTGLILRKATDSDPCRISAVKMWNIPFRFHIWIPASSNPLIEAALKLCLTVNYASAPLTASHTSRDSLDRLVRPLSRLVLIDSSISSHKVSDTWKQQQPARKYVFCLLFPRPRPDMIMTTKRTSRAALQLAIM